MITKDITSVKEITQDMKRIQNMYPSAIAGALTDEAWLIMNMSQDQCPVEFGRLRATGQVGVPENNGNSTSIKMGYSTDYAIYVHENLEARHLAPTKAKFLEDPVDFYRWGFMDRVGRRINERMMEAMSI
jgi:hypothetical protein